MAHVTLDLSKYDALTAYKGLPDEKEENPARFFPDTSSVRRCVPRTHVRHGSRRRRTRQESRGPPLKRRRARGDRSDLHPLRVQMFDLLHIRTETLPSAYAGRLL